jgi:hypothetical protein
MIKTTTEKPHRITTADWFIFENGTERIEKIPVHYYGLTVKQLKERQAEIAEISKKDENAVIWLSDLLLPRLHSLPELGDENGQPVELTIEFLESQDLRNLRNLQKAIEEDESPKSETKSV